MTVDLNPETERMVREEIRRGRFHSVDEVIAEAVSALREKSRAEQTNASPGKSHKKLYDLLTQPPFAGSELDLERQSDYLRPVDL